MSAFLYDAVRTPFGKFNGGLAQVRPDDLAATVLTAIRDRNPGLDRRSRSLITLTALIARGHHEEFAMHVRAARTNGLTNDEIKELILQSAIYCGVPDANTAFRIAQGVLDELDGEGDS